MNLDNPDKILFNLKTSETIPIKEAECEFKILDIPSDYNNCKIDFDADISIRINSSKFHTACDQLYKYSNNIYISCNETQLILMCIDIDNITHKRIFSTDGTYYDNDDICIRTINHSDIDINKTINFEFNLVDIVCIKQCKLINIDMELYFCKKQSIMFLKYINNFCEIIFGLKSQI